MPPTTATIRHHRDEPPTYIFHHSRWGRDIELVLGPSRCTYGACPNTICVEGYDLDSKGRRKYDHNKGSYELVPAVLADVEAFAKGNTMGAVEAAADARALSDKGKYVLAAGRLVHSLEYSVGVSHPLTKWLGSIVAATDHPDKAYFSERYG